MLGGAGPARTDCLVMLGTTGIGFPGGAKVFKGTTCADGDPCDADGARNGSCLFTPVVCLNQTDPALPKCTPAQIKHVKLKAKNGKKKVDASALNAAVAALGLPTSTAACSVPVEVAVPLVGPNKKGEILNGEVKVNAKAKTTKGADKDTYQLVCRPGSAPVGTTVPPTSTTSTTLPLGTPGPGLDAGITGAAIAADGHVTITFHLSDANGTIVTPTTSSTDDPREARVRFTLARLEPDVQKAEAVTTTFSRYVNYITNSSGQPAYD